MHVQGWIPPLNQIALLGDPRRVSGWCGVRHDVGCASSDCIIKTIVVGDAVAEAIGNSEVNRNVTAGGQFFDERIVSANILN